MNCFHHPVDIKAKIARKNSKFHHLAEKSGNVQSGSLIRRCLSQISPDEPEKGIAAARVMQCALREINNQDRVKRSLSESYGVNYLLTSLNQAIQAYENYGRVDELMFVSMRIGRELSHRNFEATKPVSRIF
ncbi:MAG: hypothetical protein P1U89_07150 [Verrucomicrobiales bacterium]|nr:hypothetical protein [Verrucomicrobiales bacterium]